RWSGGARVRLRGAGADNPASLGAGAFEHSARRARATEEGSMKETRVGGAIYARVSSERQADAGTIESQVEALLQRAAQDGVFVAENMRFLDNGYTGSTDARPALERLRDVADAGSFDVLYIHSPDRLARRYVRQAVLIEELEAAGVEVIFLNRPFGDNPEEQLLLQMQGVFAEYERTKILERSRRGRLYAARRGSVNVLSKAPYGYQYIPSDETRQAELRICTATAAIVRDIFHWFTTERLPIQRICQRLAEQGITSPGEKRTWCRSTVHKLLKNPAYKGMAAYGKTRAEERNTPLRPRRGCSPFPKRPNSTRKVDPTEWISIPVPPIVSEDVFEEAQEQLQANRRVAARHARGGTHLLQGLV